jgi:hypothetical protein
VSHLRDYTPAVMAIAQLLPEGDHRRADARGQDDRQWLDRAPRREERAGTRGSSRRPSAPATRRAHDASRGDAPRGRRGALAMYSFDPDRGRRRRSLLRDQTVHWVAVTMESWRRNGATSAIASKGGVARVPPHRAPAPTSTRRSRGASALGSHRWSSRGDTRRRARGGGLSSAVRCSRRDAGAGAALVRARSEARASSWTSSSARRAPTSRPCRAIRRRRFRGPVAVGPGWSAKASRTIVPAVVARGPARGPDSARRAGSRCGRLGSGDVNSATRPAARSRERARSVGGSW